jgi:hypothetical protein
MKYDDASWHYDGDFPEDLPIEAGAIHIGMFVAWCLLNGFEGSLWADEFPDQVEALKTRSLTPGRFLIEFCDEKFVDEELNDEGNAFAESYFQDKYFVDYAEALASNLPSCYHAADTWENYDKLARVISDRYEEWKDGKLEASAPVEIPLDQIEDKPWWKFW